MKIANAIIGGFITSVLLIGVLFKIMHWSGASIMIILSSAFLAIFVYLAAAQNILSYENNILLKICNGLCAFFGSIVIIGFLFKIMHWPGSGIMLILGFTLSSFLSLLFIAVFLTSKEPIRISSGTFFSLTAFGILAFGVSLQSPSYSLLNGIVNNNQKAEMIARKNNRQLRLHNSNTLGAKPYYDTGIDLHTHIKKLKSKLYEYTDAIPKEIADTINLKHIYAKDNYDEPTRILGLMEPGYPKKIQGLEEFSGTTLSEKIKSFNVQMTILDSSFSPIKTNEVYRHNGGIDSWETANFYHMPLAQVILTLNLIDAEALAACNYHITKNYPIKKTNQNGK